MSDEVRCPVEMFEPDFALTGSRRFVFSPKFALKGGRTEMVPCGQCMRCRVSRRGELTTRFMHEAQLHEQAAPRFGLSGGNCFVTLTYDAEHLSAGRTLVKSDVQNFMKRLRKAIWPRKVRFYAAGEYGEQNGRPHYHALLFGYDPSDQVLDRSSKTGKPMYRSATMARLWPKGLVSVQPVTVKTARYVAGYVVDKLSGPAEQEMLSRPVVCPVTGEVVSGVRREPQFALRSLKPGLGHGWFERFRSDCASGFLIVDGKKVPVPQYYRRKESEAVQRAQKAERVREAEKRDARELEMARIPRGASRFERELHLQRRRATKREIVELRMAKAKREL